MERSQPGSSDTMRNLPVIAVQYEPVGARLCLTLFGGVNCEPRVNLPTPLNPYRHAHARLVSVLSFAVPHYVAPQRLEFMKVLATRVKSAPFQICISGSGHEYLNLNF
jgi:hypothetical protein